MRKVRIKNIALALSILVVSGCQTFFEEDITDQKVLLLAPGNNIETDIATQTFWWNQIEGASNYRLQVVTPSFESVESVILDTLTEANRFTKALYPSGFQWRVRAENSGFITDWSERKLLVYSTSDLTRQSVNILSPGTITNNSSVRFEWDALYNAAKYTVIVYNSQWDGVVAVQPTSVTSSFWSKSLEDGHYVWGVKAENADSETIYSQKSLTVDSTPPTVPALKNPVNKSSGTNSKVQFSWYSFDKTSGIAHDTLAIYTDKELTQLVKSVVTNQQSAEISFNNRSTYYWTISSVDQAGNSQKSASSFSFTIQ